MIKHRKRIEVELDELRRRLRDAEETLSAIRSGEVDALIVSGPSGDQVFSLHGAEQPYRVFVEQMQEGAVTLSADGTILYCNRRFAEMVRTPLERVISSPLQTFIRTSQTEVDAILAGTSRRGGEFMLAAGDGSILPVHLTFSQMPLEDVAAICLVVTDLTEQKEKRELASALENLKQAQEQLQRQNDELAKARRAAENASNAKDDFLASLSHELRTPLTPVLMTATSLANDPTLSDAVRGDLTMMRRNVELEARLIDDLLDITRIVNGKISMQSDVVDAHALLQSALEICRGDAEVKGLSVQMDLRAGHHRVEGDGVRLQQIFWNVVRNAVKFTPAGGQIRVSTGNDGGGRMIVTVSDTGIGIDADAIVRIFSPFEQADRVVARQFGGLGLGLAISRRLVELHRGTILATSDGKGRGATFTITLPTLASPPGGDAPPAAAAAASRSPSPAEATEAAAIALPGHRALRILLVEDHDDTRHNIARLLGALEHRVEQTRDIREALDAAAAQSFDLVISDLGLPDGSGLDLMRQLRQRHGLRGICLSGYGSDEDIARSIDAGFCEHFVKPINFADLERALERFMS